MNKKRKGPPEHLTTNPLLKELGGKARTDFRAVVDAEKNEINALKEEQIKEEHFWKGYSNNIKQQVKSENIFEEVQKFESKKIKEKNNIFKKIIKILGF